MPTVPMTISRFMPMGLIFALSALVSSAGHAHVVLKDATAPAGGYYVATFRVPHGCGASPTAALRITIPEGVVTAKPMPKPGWRIDLAFEALDEPVKNERQLLTQRITTVTWTGGPLPSEYFDEFSMMVRLPNRTGPLYFPAVQVCETGESRWVEVPPEGKTIGDMQFPPPVVTLVPAPGPRDH